MKQILKPVNIVFDKELENILPDSEPALNSIDPDIAEEFNLSFKKIPVCRPYISAEDIGSVHSVVKDGWVSSLAPVVKEFEKRFAECLGIKYAISCSSGTAALHLATKAIGVTAGDFVVHPDFTMIAVPNSVIYTGGRSVLVDSGKNDWNMDLDILEQWLKRSGHSKAKAIIATHTYGIPSDLSRLVTMCKKYDLFLIEDSAEALGIIYNGDLCGTFGDIGTFSLYANKTITSGEGGMVITNDDKLASVIRTLMNHGFSEERHFWHKFVGNNYRMSAMQAALGLSQLNRIDEILRTGEKVMGWYNHYLSPLKDKIILPNINGELRQNCWMYGIQIKEPFNKDKIRKILARRGVETRNFFIPISLQPAYYGFCEVLREESDLSKTNSAKLMSTGFYLPTFLELKEEDIMYICSVLKESLK